MTRRERLREIIESVASMRHQAGPLLRIFRVFKLARFLGEQNLLMTSLRLGRTKICVFLATVLLLDLILGTATSRPSPRSGR